VEQRVYKILIIEDEDHIAEGLALHLKLQGYEVLRARDGQEGLMLWSKEAPDCIVLDIMMPKIDGHRVLELVRKKDVKLPILILSARDSAQDKILALSRGVDDYLSKPFDAEELLLRIERLLIRSGWYAQTQKDSIELRPKLQIETNIQIGASDVCLKSGRFLDSEGAEQILTEQELRLLKIFVTYEGIPMGRKDLLGLAWDYAQNVETRTLDNFIVRLRKYFEPNTKKPQFFRSVRALGYVFSREP
jgi:two-component system, OmpR family, alkaline phosphatase synthesis response regulator PhoP